MNLKENIREGLKSIQANLLRSILTAMIVAIGITSLVGILTAVDGIQASINQSFTALGANSFQIRSKMPRGHRQSGVQEKSYPPITYKEAQRFEDLFEFPSDISISASVTGIAEVKYLSRKTNPNVWVLGANQYYLPIKGMEIEKGRNFSNLEMRYGANVVILGEQVEDVLFEDHEEPLNKMVTILGTKYKLIGILKKQGMIGGGGTDRSVIVPVKSAMLLGADRQMQFIIEAGIGDPTQLEVAMAEATGLMRSIRRDPIGEEDSFEIRRSQTLAERLGEITGWLRMGGFGIGFITLIGASIGLMNIMMVSVTERTREIGIRKAIGASPRKIRLQFLIEAIVICQLGGILGILLGIGIGNVVSKFVFEAPLVIPWIWIIVAFTVGVMVGLISGYYPAFKASRLDPIESLRFE